MQLQKDNASVMVVPFNKENVVKVIVTSEDSKTTNTYKIKLIAKDQIADKAFMEKVEGEIKQAEALKKMIIRMVPMRNMKKH